MYELAIRQQSAAFWFRNLRDDICTSFEKIEQESLEHEIYGEHTLGNFTRKAWQRKGGGDGEMSLMKGRVFEKVGVNISTVHGTFNDTMQKEIPGAAEDPRFWASGISLVAHMRNPNVPSIHMNTRFLVIGEGGMTESGKGRSWFGGGIDLTPAIPMPEVEQRFHDALKTTCNAHDKKLYDKYRKWCDEYFFIKHRGEVRGAGGIFYDYVNTGDWEKDFAFTKDIGTCFNTIFPDLVRATMDKPWNDEQHQALLHKRGRYVEFNLIYDRGTRFGLMTDGNPEAILMSLPPQANWE